HAGVHEPVGLQPSSVVASHLMPRIEEALRHTAPHHAQTDKSQIGHYASPLCVGPTVAPAAPRYRRATSGSDSSPEPVPVNRTTPDSITAPWWAMANPDRA